MQQPRAVVLFHGLWVGWMAVLLLARSGVITFQLLPPAEGILNQCFLAGYPKQQDYFWYAAMLLGGWAGAGVSLLVHQRLLRSSWNGSARNGLLAGGVFCTLATTVLAFSQTFASSPVTFLLAILGAVLPWLDRYWYANAPAFTAELPTAVPPTKRMSRWVIGCFVVAGIWGLDTCMPYRWIDGYHEGNRLLLLQSYLSGDLPGVNLRLQYGPLYEYSFFWWMKIFGITISAERWYFMMAQILGTAVHLILVRLVCRSWMALAVGGWLTLSLTTSTALGFGWANMLRTALPLLALMACVEGVQARRGALLVASGILNACALLYSQEYGLSGLVGCGVVFVACALRPGMLKPTLRDLATWSGVFLLTFAGVLLLIFGLHVGTALRLMFVDTYAAARLMGHEAGPWRCSPGGARWTTCWPRARRCST